MSFIPLYIHINKQALQTEQEMEAIHLLYDTINVFLQEGSRQDQEISRGGKQYTILWSNEDTFNSSRVCIQYEDVFEKNVEKCETVER